jgi:hypothetical membrane protein
MPITRPHAIYAAVTAGLVLVFGLLAAQVTWPSFSPMKQTMSSLAARDAPTRWLMTAVIVAVGVCQLIAAHGFKQAAKPGRWVLAIGGIGALGVAAFPVPHILDDSNWHTFMAAVVLVSLCLWPVFSVSRRHEMPWVLTHRGAWTSTICLAVVGLIFLAAWWTNSDLMGLLERTLISSQILWLLVALRVSYKFGVRKTVDAATQEDQYSLATNLA